MSEHAATAVPERLTVGRVELARMLGCSPKTIDRNRAALPLPVRVGKLLRWSREEVLAFIREKKTRPA